MKKFLALFACAGLFLTSCSDDDNAPDPVDPGPTEPTAENFSAGSADFSNYVAVGNSLTAGFSDNALFIDGQEASLPNMLANSFSVVGGGEFSIPFVADNLGGLTLGGQPIRGNRLILSFRSGSPAPVPVEGEGSTDVSQVQEGPFNNLGIPGAKSFHLGAPGYGNIAGLATGSANPYYVRIASSPNATIIGDAVAQSPTFFSLWIGNNDILSFATSGGAGVDQTGNLDPSTYGGNDITDPMVFAGTYNSLLQALTSTGAQGVVANIPNVTDIPYFTTVPHNPVPLDESNAGAVNMAYAPYNGGLAQLQAAGVISAEELERRTISFSAGATNAVVILDEDLTDLTAINPALINMRQATEEDLMVLTSRSFIGTLANEEDPTSINGVAVPLADQWVLTPEEQTSVATALAAYNQTIAGLATQYDLALVDANAFLETFAETGVPLADGSTASADFGTGGGFSLDGVHPSPRGYALLANLFLESIETKYGATLPEVNPLEFTGLYIN
ncbi:MAG: G-D-S-L family lipolytic protein [Pricia sp.]